MIVQFGTSRFLQAHVDLFASEARDAGQNVPPIIVVQTTNDIGRARRLLAFADPRGFPVLVRGRANGALVDRAVRVRSIAAGLQAAREWDKLVRLVRDEATHIVSNTGDRGYEIPDADLDTPNDAAAPGSFVAILVSTLHARWRAGRDGLIVLPCELIPRNGSLLCELAVALSERQSRPVAFVEWLRRSCVWVDTLVDRIVSTALEPAGAITEPYALWAVQRTPRLSMPFEHPAVTVVDDLDPYERLKLHILNLGHSWLAQRWQQGSAEPGTTVGDMLADPKTLAALNGILNGEVLEGFDRRGLHAQAAAYIPETIERFRNPFLDHKVSDIFQSHQAKIARRVGGFVRWVDEVEGPTVPMPHLRSWIATVEEVRI